MSKRKRLLRRVLSVVVMVFVTATLFLFSAYPVSARVANGNTYFKYAAATYRDVEGEVALGSSNFDFASNSINDFYFKTFLPTQANSVAFRMEMTSVFNNLLTHWYAVRPSMANAEATNVGYYTFYIVERSYVGDIVTVAYDDYIYMCSMYLSRDPVNGEGVFTITNERYGGKYMGRYRDSAVNPLPQWDSNTDIIISLYSGLRTDFTVNMNLIVGSGSGSRDDYSNIENGTNTVPSVPDDWRDKLHNDDDLYEEVQIQLSDILDYISNPATMLNSAMAKTSTGLRWQETRAVLASVESILSIPLVNVVAWAVALFGSVFSLFNLGISFVSSGGSKH